MWARRRHELQAEQQLAASCEVEGPGAYVDAQGWFAVRVCVLPARSMHQFPAMFRVRWTVHSVALCLTWGLVLVAQQLHRCAHAHYFAMACFAREARV
jgi:hypothetical protein